MLLYRLCNFHSGHQKLFFKGPFSDKTCFAMTMRLLYHPIIFLSTQKVSLPTFIEFILGWYDCYMISWNMSRSHVSILLWHSSECCELFSPSLSAPSLCLPHVARSQEFLRWQNCNKEAWSCNAEALIINIEAILDTLPWGKATKMIQLMCKKLQWEWL